MRKGILFKKGIIIALAAAMTTASAPIMVMNGCINYVRNIHRYYGICANYGHEWLGSSYSKS